MDRDQFSIVTVSSGDRRSGLDRRVEDLSFDGPDKRVSESDRRVGLPDRRRDTQATIECSLLIGSESFYGPGIEAATSGPEVFRDNLTTRPRLHALYRNFPPPSDLATLYVTSGYFV